MQVPHHTNTLSSLICGISVRLECRKKKHQGSLGQRMKPDIDWLWPCFLHSTASFGFWWNFYILLQRCLGKPLVYILYYLGQTGVRIVFSKLNNSKSHFSDSPLKTMLWSLYYKFAVSPAAEEKCTFVLYICQCHLPSPHWTENTAPKVFCLTARMCCL